MGRLAAVLLLALTSQPCAWTQGTQPQSATCSRCHEEGRTQPETDMAHALETAERDPVLIDNPLIEAVVGKFSYRIERKADRSIFSVTDGRNSITASIRWAVGASSALGQTYILERDGKFYESRMSWFKELKALGPTLGALKASPSDLNEALGRQLSEDETRRCLDCHSTGAVSHKLLTLDTMTPGVQCSHCHEATLDHIAALAKNSQKPLVPAGLTKLKHLSAEQASNFCGRCHRTWSDVVTRGDYSVNNVRFQPYRLWSSRCYDPDDVRISCLSCHNPHTQVSSQPTDYDAKCLACHSGNKARAKSCKTSMNRCVSCHMPKVELRGAHYSFTDHRIHIVTANDRFLP